MLAGLPLFMHSVRVAAGASRIDDVLVSSDNREVQDRCRAEKVWVHRRSPALCAPEVQNFDVLCALLAELRSEGINPEIVALLQPTTPFRTSAGLDALIKAFQEDETADSCVTIRKLDRARGPLDPETHRWLPKHENATRIKSDDPLFEVTGHVFLMRPARTLDHGTLLGAAVRGEPLCDSWIDIDIDTPRELALAQSLAAEYFK